jgi:hypothetical protein
MEVVIDKNIPVPEKRVSPWRHIAKNMKHGESILVDTQKHAASLGAAIRGAGKGYRRQIQEDGSIRVWCVDKDSL